MALFVLTTGCAVLDPDPENRTSVYPSPDCGPAIFMASNAEGTVFTVTGLMRQESFRLLDLTYNITRIDAEGQRNWTNGLQGSFAHPTFVSNESRVRYVDHAGSNETLDIGDEVEVGGEGPYDIEVWNRTNNLGGTWRCL